MVAREIQNQLDLLYADTTNNNQNAMSYLDICIITGYVQDAFIKKIGEVPPVVAGACNLARGYMNPDKAGAKDDLRKGIGLLMSAAGGLALVWGILLWAGVGASVWAMAMALIFGTGIPVGGPIAVAAGVVAIAAGVYLALRKKTPTERSAKAHEDLVKAINTWAVPTGHSPSDSLMDRDIAIRSFKGNYVSCDMSNGCLLTAAFAKKKDGWERFHLTKIDGFFYIRSVASGKYVSVDRNAGGVVTASLSDHPGEWERFSLHEHESHVYILNSNGKWVMTDMSHNQRLVAQVEKPVEWEKFQLEAF